ncbi:GntR family transcriptional regulator [Arsenicicoccus bolidensis]|uniref:GntR family transcriptional regulator n=1 Tax=Arsenicicoccus bolidensis TaxID=229480 RepID=A0ABS9PYV9_9MICO|nr:GntR family transcriptional regulator [Arsenicicoccus bolidensis]MCG7320813.1 GntR family transcriptional regulator [Arsenicicoccus bolidensis]
MTRESPTENEQPSRRLARELRGQITAGDLAPGDKLPSERALAAEHGVARNTAREAVRLLADEGLVTAEHGRGVFVRGKNRLMRFGQRRYARTLRRETGLSPYRAEVEAQGRTPRVECTSITRITPAPEIAERLGIDPEAETVVRRENWYYADEEPMQVGVTYSPWHIVEGTPVADSAKMGKGSLYARFEEQGYAITSIREEVTARMPTPSEVAGLAIPDGVPVLDVTHTGYDEHGRPFEVTVFVMRADFNALDYRMSVED